MPFVSHRVMPVVSKDLTRHPATIGLQNIEVIIPLLIGIETV